MVSTAMLLAAAFAAMSVNASPSRATLWNHCSPTIWSNVPHSIPLVHVEKNSHDTWGAHRAPEALRAAGTSPYGSWNPISGESGFARGCRNVLRWGDMYGTIEVYTDDPYSGPNLYHCKTTGWYDCYEQEGLGHLTSGFEHNVLTGDHLSVNYKICMYQHPCPGGRNPPPQFPAPKAGP